MDWFNYVYSNIGKFKSVRGKVHEYLPMTLYYTTKGEVKIDMQKYVKTWLMNFQQGSKKISQ